jgi:prophage tail gpP-like protein
MAEQRAEQVSLLIDGQLYSKWTEIEIKRAIDSFSTVTFSAPFEPDRSDFRDTFRPFTFKPIEVRISSIGVEGQDFTLFRGTMMGVHPRVDPGSSVVEVTAYALPGVLEDCTMPGASVPFEFQKLGLREIARACCLPFGIVVSFADDEGSPFDKAKLEEDQKVLAFLTDLAKQRGIVITNTTEGELLFWRSVAPGNPVAQLVEGVPPLTAVTSSYEPQEYFSEITGFASAKRGRAGSKYTVPNPHVAGVFRPTSFKLEDTDIGDVPAAVRAKLGRMFAGMCAYSIDGLPTWRTPADDLFGPNTTLLLTAPSAMVYAESEFLIRAVTYRQTAESESCSLELCLPGAFDGNIPEVLPWVG